MPIDFEILEGQRVVIAKGSGIVSGEDVVAHLLALADDERYVAPMKKLVDYRYIESIEISQEEARIIAAQKRVLEGRFAGEKCAFVSPDPLAFGTTRVHQTLISSVDIDTNVFRKMEDALKWLEKEFDSE